MYRDIHSWAGIVCGLFLFTAFYAGAITMFEGAIDRWAAAPVTLSPPPPLSATPRLIEQVVATHPDAGRQFDIIVEPGPEAPARLIWPADTAGANEDHGGPARVFAASFGPDGTLEVASVGDSGAAQFVDTIHQQVGLPFERDTALIFSGIIALLYAVALVSGLIVLLPSLIKDLFRFRFGRNFKRQWLDIHNAVGLFSLPFHVVMAVTTVVFAFHDQIYGTQDVVLYESRIEALWSRPPVSPHPADTPLLAADAIVARVEAAAPGFSAHRLAYRRLPNGRWALTVWGEDPRYANRAPEGGLLTVDPHDGAILDASYRPGATAGWQPAVTTFFALHFGSFGGPVIRWNYFALGLAGAFLIYTGNILWVDGRRRRETRKGGRESPTTGAMDRLTIGWMMGVMAGISLMVAAAKWLPALGVDPAPWTETVFYMGFAACVGWAFLRPRARIGAELFTACAVATVLVPLASLGALAVPPVAWAHGGTAFWVDLGAGVGAIAFWALARRSGARAGAIADATRRARQGFIGD